MSEYLQHLLIDGYNVIHQWPEYRRLMKSGIVSAAERLVEDVRPIHDIDSVRVTIVFDGQGNLVQVERPSAQLTFSVLYAPAELTADGLIEQIVARASAPHQCTVVSRDNLVGESIRASGAVLMTVDWLFDWVERCQRRMDTEVHARRRKERSSWKERGSSVWDALPKTPEKPKKPRGGQ